MPYLSRRHHDCLLEYVVATTSHQLNVAVVSDRPSISNSNRRRRPVNLVRTDDCCYVIVQVVVSCILVVPQIRVRWQTVCFSISVHYDNSVRTAKNIRCVHHYVTGPSRELWLYERCPFTVRDLLYWGITTTQRRTSGRLIRSGDLHSTAPKQKSTLTVMSEIAIAILANERWTLPGSSNNK